MFSALRRKSRQLAHDPVLRRWLLGIALGQYGRPRRFVMGKPPYLDNVAIPKDATPSNAQTAQFDTLRAIPPVDALTLALPGEVVTLSPENPAALFDRKFGDTETLLAVHRFAWVPLVGRAVDPAWVGALWREWSARYGQPDESWAWHPYTAAERAINILNFTAVHGLPGDRETTLAILSRHAPVITSRLEYFGDHNTSNHLSNNGRGLYLLGLALGMEDTANIGARILLAEASRLFQQSGTLREGSTHYHLLLTRNYASAWLAARRHDRPEKGTLEAIVQRALEAIPHFLLPGGMPLIGDISPDCPPDFLFCLLPDGDTAKGWGSLLPAADVAAIETLKSRCRTVSPDRAAADGWLRFTAGNWAGLWHAPRDGWPPMPGHSHQDLGSFELHYQDTPLFIDPGRGAYGDEGDAAYFTSAAAHNSLLIDGCGPYPPNKPYYDDTFRRSVAGPPLITRARDSVTVAHPGYSRFRGVGEVARTVSFAQGVVTITDRIEGSGTHRISRRLHTALPVRADGESVIIDGIGNGIRITADAKFVIGQSMAWSAYGVSKPATIIDMTISTELPIRLNLTVAVE